ncbi:unnamed protein product [Rotaria sordida]|uniref:Uncharacterized protein n=1 Tax=Rotaria sordida TaxID=392033 RepID=A0A814RIV1_9BILA|nr:unnamed protein product [Rotaria sordida]CAF1133043.1 unnamed protein product [Rotaria sordida]
MEKNISNKCKAYKSLPNVRFLSKSNEIAELHKSKSLPSCLKFLYKKYPYNKKFLISKQINIKKNQLNLIEKKNLNPTIGELLGDDDLFHYHYHKQYNSSRFKRKRHHYRKHQHEIKEFQYQSFQSNESTSKIKNQIYFYPTTTTYNYTPLPTYCYYCYSNISSYFISDYYKSLYE